MLDEKFVILGTLISSVGTIAYIIDTLKGKVKPNRISFLLWSIAPLIAFYAQIKQGVGMESLMTLSTGVFPLIVLLASFANKEAEWKLTMFDLCCGLLSFVGVIVWYFTKEPNLAILFSILADGLAALPTIVKAYKFPETEVAWPWLMTSIGVIFTFLTMKTFNFQNSAFIIYIFSVNILISALAQFRPKSEQFESRK